MKKVAQERADKHSKRPERPSIGLVEFDLHRERVETRLRAEAEESAHHRQEYRVLSNERESGSLAELPLFAVAAYAMGSAGGDPIDALIEEIATRCATLRAASLGGLLDATTLEAELHMLERRADAAREMARRTRDDASEMIGRLHAVAKVAR